MFAEDTIWSTAFCVVEEINNLMPNASWMQKAVSALEIVYSVTQAIDSCN